MEIRGRIIQDLPLQQGTSAAGRAWKKQEFILETFDQYPRKVIFTIFGDKVDQLGPQFATYRQNMTDVTVSFDLESRSFMGRDGVERWSTEVRPWRILDSATAQMQMPGNADPAGFVAPQYAPQPQQQFAQPQQQFVQPQPVVPQFAAEQPAADPQPQAASDDLPF